MHSLIEIGQVVLDKKRTFKIFKYYFIKSVLPPLSEEHSPSFEQIEERCIYMNQKADTDSEGPAERIDLLGQQILEFIGPNITKQDRGPT